MELNIDNWVDFSYEINRELGGFRPSIISDYGVVNGVMYRVSNHPANWDNFDGDADLGVTKFISIVIGHWYKNRFDQTAQDWAEWQAEHNDTKVEAREIYIKAGTELNDAVAIAVAAFNELAMVAELA